MRPFFARKGGGGVSRIIVANDEFGLPIQFVKRSESFFDFPKCLLNQLLLVEGGYDDRNFHCPLVTGLAAKAQFWYAFHVSDVGRIVSLHIHLGKGGELMVSADSLQLEARKGIVEDKRYFGKSKRQVTLIEREQLHAHADALGINGIGPGQARANIETSGINLHALLGREVQIGEAVLLLYEDRTPCYKMDAVCQGMRKLMENGKQGVLAQVMKSGVIKIGDTIQARST